MSTPLKVLVVSPIPSHPPVQGNSARILAFGSELKRRGVEADFLYYGMEGLSKEQAEVMIGFWHRFYFVRSQPLQRPTFARSWGIDDWCADQLCDMVKTLAKTHRYHAIIVNYVWMSKVLVGIDGPLKMIDTHDVFGNRHLTAEEQGLEPRWFFTTMEEECKGYERADIVIGIQENESAQIRRRHSAGGGTSGADSPTQAATEGSAGPVESGRAERQSREREIGRHAWRHGGGQRHRGIACLHRWVPVRNGPAMVGKRCRQRNHY